MFNPRSSRQLTGIAAALILTALSAPSFAQATAMSGGPMRIAVPTNDIYPLSKPIAAPKIQIDVTDCPAAIDWANQAKTLIQQWFPVVSSELATEHYKRPKVLILRFKQNMDAPAATSGTTESTCVMNISGNWIAQHPDDFGMVIHEMTHVIQGYSSTTYSNAGWLVEGIADYVRFYKYQPDYARYAVVPRDPASASYHDAYRTTASFIAYVSNKYDFGLLYKLDGALRAGTYTDADWKTITGKSVDDLWAEFTAAAEAGHV